MTNIIAATILGLSIIIGATIMGFLNDFNSCVRAAEGQYPVGRCAAGAPR